jgi:hypothetical protein
MHLDDTIIARHGQYSVLAHHVELAWPDCSTLRLHAMHLAGYPDRFHWATLHVQRRITNGQADLRRWLVVDTRTLARTIADDVRAAPARDHQGIVTVTLRLQFPCAWECRRAIMANTREVWQDNPAPPAKAPSLWPAAQAATAVAAKVPA